MNREYTQVNENLSHPFNSQSSAFNSFRFLGFFFFSLLWIVSCKEEIITPDPVEEKKYEIGDWYEKGDVKGVVFKTDSSGKHGFIVSLTAINSNKYQWATVNEITYAVDEFDGKINLYHIISQANWETHYPAFGYWHEQGWYIPAINELKTISENINSINATIEKNGGAVIGNTVLSSTELSENQVYAVQFGDNLVEIDYIPVLKRKETPDHHIRGVREF